MAYLKQKFYSSAIKDFKQAIERDPGSAKPNLYYNLAKAYLLNRNLDQAIQGFTKTIKIKPTYGLAYANRGVAFKDKGDYDKAARDFRKALTLLNKPSRVAAVRRLLKETNGLMKRSRPKSLDQLLTGGTRDTNPRQPAQTTFLVDRLDS